MNKNDETIRKLSEIIREAERMQKSYFWKPPTNAGARRSYEKQHTHPEIRWHENGAEWTARYDVICSCSNVYASGTYTRDGAKTTLTAVRNSLIRMEAKNC